jgi:putative ABC transport system permease protein
VTNLRFAFRALIRDNRVTAAAVLTLALGIGLSTLMFSVFYNVVIAPFPYQSSDRLVTFGIRNTTNAGSAVGRDFFTAEEFRGIREQNGVFAAVVAYSRAASVLYRNTEGEIALPGIAAVTPDTFAFYGVPPFLGRTLVPADGAPGAPPVFVMSHQLWRSQCNGDRSVLGTTFILNGVPRTLVGVMPPRFNIYRVALWVPIDIATQDDTLQIVGRLKPGVSLPSAAADLDMIAHRLTAAEPSFALTPEHYKVVVSRLIDQSVGPFGKALNALMVAVLFLLLIACVNVANMLLTRATVREREFAIRSALGASRGRILRQILLESVVLSSAAGLLGIALAIVGLRAVSALMPPNLVPPEAVIRLNFQALSFAIGISAAATLLCGLAPALFTLRIDPASGLTSRGTKVGDFRRSAMRNSFVVAEIAFSVVLLTGAGLMMRNFFMLTRADLPFDPAKTLFLRLNLPHDRYYANPDPKPAFFSQVLPRIGALPGVVAAAETLMLPPNEGSWTDVAIPGKPHTERWTTDFELCTEGYFQAIGLQLQRGRLFSRDDVARSRYVAVVNHTLAQTYFPGEDPVGKRIKFEVLDRPFIDGPHNTWFEIVGIVSDYKTRPERTAFTLRPEAYLPASAAGFGNPLHIVVQATGDKSALLHSIQRQVWDVDPNVAVSASGTIADLLNEDFRQPRFQLQALGMFASIGLLLTAIGVFSVTMYSVSLRTHEIGIRMAIGAKPSRILSMVITKALLLVLTGVATGVALSLGLGHLLQSVVWGICATDPFAHAMAIVVIISVSILASLLPAHRAAKVNPAIALRAE